MAFDRWSLRRGVLDLDRPSFFFATTKLEPIRRFRERSSRLILRFTARTNGRGTCFRPKPRVQPRARGCAGRIMATIPTHPPVDSVHHAPLLHGRNLAWSALTRFFSRLIFFDSAMDWHASALAGLVVRHHCVIQPGRTVISRSKWSPPSTR